jgi:Concanavalin A-like lectin/glucanases superfamily
VRHPFLRTLAGSSAGPTTDPNFENVTLLLHGDGTNGAQNNTFLDGSTNNFTITRNGNVTQGTFSPYGDNWSNQFDGTDDYLSIADNVNLRAGSGAFTIEAWIYRNATGAAHTIFAKGGASTGIVLQVASTDVLRFTHTTTNIDSTGTIALGTWTHVAVVREGTGTNETKLYINGSQDGQGTVSTDFTQTEEVRIGTDRSAAADFNGYISNLRFVKGTAVYTAAFTVPTAPLIAISNTQLLTCKTNRFRDDSSNGFTVTTNNNVSVQRFSPLSPTAAYAAGTIGGSGYFDGTGDYLSFTGTGFNVGTGAFTLEGWIYPSASQYSGIVSTWLTTGGSVGFLLGISNTRIPEFFIGNAFGTGNSTGVVGATAIPLNAWTHLAATKAAGSGGTMTLYVNGVSVGTNTTTRSVDRTAAVIGRYYQDFNGNYLTGLVSDVRVSNVVRSISVPASPISSDANTLLLASCTNAGVIDNAMIAVPETVGNAQLDTTTKKFGTGSLKFDGTGDWLLVPDSIDQRLGTGNFTIECWLYLSATGAARGIVGKGTSTTGWLLSTNSSNAVVFTYGTSTITSTGTLSGATWYHIAVVREGTGTNQTKIYIGGTNDGTGTVSTDFTQTNAGYVGANRTAGDALNGYIDDLRITKGVARYTANFTPPTAAFPDL